MSGDSNDGTKSLPQTAPEAPDPESTARLPNGQFNKGFSGNLRGRPKKFARAWSHRQANLDTVSEANRMLRVIENGKVEYITTQQALIRQLLRMGIKGDIKAGKMVLDRIDRAQSSREYKDADIFRELERMERLYDEMVEIGGEAKANEIISEYRKKTQKW